VLLAIASCKPEFFQLLVKLFRRNPVK